MSNGEQITTAAKAAQSVMTFLTDNIADKDWCPAWLSRLLYKGRAWSLWQKNDQPWKRQGP